MAKEGSRARAAWTSHLKGIGALLVHLGEDILRTDFGCHMFVQIQQQAVRMPAPIESDCRYLCRLCSNPHIRCWDL